MAMNRFIFAAILLLFSVHIAFAQEEAAPQEPESDAGEEIAVAPEAVAPQIERSVVKLHDFQTVLMTSLRETFPRNPGIFSAAHSCRLPEYGPVISITMQLPAVFFTRQLMQELERSRKIAEENANRIRTQIDRAAAMMRLRSREAEITDRIQQVEYGSRKKDKAESSTLQTELEEVRKSLKELEARFAAPQVPSQGEPMSDVDIEKMLSTNYQQLLQRITTSVRNVLAEKAPSLADVRENERITVTAHIRESFVSAQERNIIFTLKHSDIERYRAGEISLEALKEKIEIRNESREPVQ